MWDTVLDQAVEDGLNLIQIYTFWNIHEPVKGQYNWEGIADIRLFLQKCADRGLFVNMRIGPYVCAEWDNGGIPVWINYLDGVRLRANNDVWKKEMGDWMKVLTDYTRDFFADRGGPIIFSQIENELWGGAKEYIDWCGDFAESLELNVPWMMCNGDTSVKTINACNGNDCSSYLENHGQSGRILVDQPGCWTENEGWFQSHGAASAERDDYVGWDARTGEDYAFNVLKFMDRGGSYHNYYMWFGGNHYGKWAGNGMTNWYTNGVLIHSDTLPNEPKHSHTAKMHRMLANIAEVLLNDKAQVNNQKHLNCDNCNAFEYKYGDRMVTFVENNKNSADKVIYRDMVYELPAWSMIVLDEYDNVLFETHNVKPVNKHRVYHCQEKLAFEYWNEPVSTLSQEAPRVVISPKANEQLNMTRDLTEFLYYETEVEFPEDECTLSIGGTDANAFVAYVDDHFVGSDDEHTHNDGWHTMNIKMNSGKGKHKLVLLSESLGVSNGMGSNLDPSWASSRLKGICGWIKLCENDIFNREWKHYPGLVGEAKQVFTDEGMKTVTWKSDVENADNLAWYRSTFKTPEGLKRGIEVLLRPEGMNRGQAYVNGHNIGRYWMIKDGNGDYSQGYCHIPKDWLKGEGEENVLVLGETLGASDPSVTICITEYVSN